MAVAKMVFASVVGPLPLFDKFVRACIMDREFHPESAEAISRYTKDIISFDQTNPYLPLLRRISTLAPHLGYDLDFEEFSELNMDEAEISRHMDKLEGDIEALEENLRKSAAEVSDTEQILNQLDYLKGINIPLDELFNLKYVKFRFGRISRANYDSFVPHILENNCVYFFPTHMDRETVYGMYMTPRRFEDIIDTAFASLRFERIRISGRAKGTPQEAAKALKEQLVVLRAEQERAKADIQAAKDAAKAKFMACYSYVKYMCDSHDIRKFAAHTEKSFYILGWVPKDELAHFSKDAEAFPDVSFTIDSPNKVSDYEPPIKLVNSPVVRPFETFLKAYGLPGYNEIDPTPIMAITYTLLFGIMFGDVGQGLVISILGFLAWKLKKIAFGRIMATIGVSSTIFGFLYGSVFGNEEILPFGLHPLGSSTITNYVLIAAVCIGVILISMAMVINIINGFKQKNMRKAFFSNNGLAGVIFYWAVLFGSVLLLLQGHNIFNPIYIIIFIVLPLVVIFLQEPLGELARGKKKLIHGSKGEFFLASLFEMVEVLISFLSNTVSFVRVGAFALNHAGMMSVVYILAKTSSDNENILVLIFGNIFVMCLEGLIAGIQVLRLEFYEMFGRFFGGEGRPYIPAKTKYKNQS